MRASDHLGSNHGSQETMKLGIPCCEYVFLRDFLLCSSSKHSVSLRNRSEMAHTQNQNKSVQLDKALPEDILFPSLCRLNFRVPRSEPEL